MLCPTCGKHMKIKLDREIWEEGQRRWHSCVRCDFQTVAGLPDMGAMQQADFLAVPTNAADDKK